MQQEEVGRELAAGSLQWSGQSVSLRQAEDRHIEHDLDRAMAYGLIITSENPSETQPVFAPGPGTVVRILALHEAHDYYDRTPWVKPILDDPSARQVWMSGRQMGQTTTLMQLVRTNGSHFPTIEQACVSYTYKSRQLLEEKLQSFLSPHFQMKRFDFAEDLSGRLPRARTLLVDETAYMSVNQVMDLEGMYHPSLCRYYGTPVNKHIAQTALAQEVKAGEVVLHVVSTDGFPDAGILWVGAIEVGSVGVKYSGKTATTFMGCVDVAAAPAAASVVLPNAQYALWQQSSQNEWIVPCSHCGGGDLRFWNMLDEKNVLDEGLACKRCHQPIDWIDGEWCCRYSDRALSGWRTSQLMAVKPHGWIEWSTIVDKQKKYLPHLLRNEVLGQPAEFLGERWIPRREGGDQP